ncbi:MAG: PEGA domain-containing protein, partial [Bacteroidota bacterium]|nr:PEGA domain-containing protein [Bacteroidota bacterium]
GAEVLVNSRNTGKRTPCELDRLTTGQHQITVRKEWYQPTTVAIDIIDGYSDNITIDMQPTFGTLNVQVEHQADIYINDKHRAKGSWNGRLISGWYTVEARKDKYHTDQKRIEINLGEEHNLSLQPKPKTGMLKVQTTPYNADIKLNGVTQGKTPATLRHLLIGSYEVQLSLKDYTIHNQSITIVENETAEIDVNMSKKIPVEITSYPTGATIIVDGHTLGVTPSLVNLPIGKKALRSKNNPITTNIPEISKSQIIINHFLLI